MIAADSSTIIAYMNGTSRADVDLFVAGLRTGDIVLPPVVLSEILSDPSLPRPHRDLVSKWPLLDILDGYWVRASECRAKLLAKRLRARLPDVLIAQSCLDYDVPLIAHDTDFERFAKHCGLKLA